MRAQKLGHQELHAMSNFKIRNDAWVTTSPPLSLRWKGGIGICRFGVSG
jgi:hypothetical protein